MKAQKADRVLLTSERVNELKAQARRIKFGTPGELVDLESLRKRVLRLLFSDRR